MMSVSSCVSVRQGLVTFYVTHLKAGRLEFGPLDRAMVQQYGQKGIRFNAIGPGATKTVIFEKNGIMGVMRLLQTRLLLTMTYNSTNEEINIVVIQYSQLGCFGETYGMAAALKFLASDDA